MTRGANKYFTLMGLLILGALGFITAMVIIFFILKLFSVTVFHIPGWEQVYTFSITVIPYFILFGAYYLVHKKIYSSKRNTAALLSAVLLTAGSLICVGELLFSVFAFFKIRLGWLHWYSDYNLPGFVLHLLLILIAAGLLASGKPAEKNWMERKKV